MDAITTGISWWAVGISTVIFFFLGGLWYSPMLFGKQWSEGVGVNIGDSSTQPVVGMVLQLAGTFFLAWIIALADAINAWPAAVLIVIALSTLLIASNLFSEHSMMASLIQGLFVLVMAVIMVVCNLVL
jgi:hypothetical protein